MGPGGQGQVILKTGVFPVEGKRFEEQGAGEQVPSYLEVNKHLSRVLKDGKFWILEGVNIC